VAARKSLLLLADGRRPSRIPTFIGTCSLPTFGALLVSYIPARRVKQETGIRS